MAATVRKSPYTDARANILPFVASEWLAFGRHMGLRDDALQRFAREKTAQADREVQQMVRRGWLTQREKR